MNIINEWSKRLEKVTEDLSDLQNKLEYPQPWYGYHQLMFLESEIKRKTINKELIEETLRRLQVNELISENSRG